VKLPKGKISIKSYNFYFKGPPFLSIFATNRKKKIKKKIKIYQDRINEDSLTTALLEVKKGYDS